MKIYKRIARFSVLMMAAIFPLQAQTTVPFTFSGTSPVTFQMDSYGSLSSIGTFGTGTFSLTGTGTRMFWYPGKAAFRAGYVSSTQWNDSNIGTYSVAFGFSSIASGSYSAAFGCSNALGTYSTALNNSYAYGSYSTAMGEGSYAFANDSVSMAGGNASGVESLAVGDSYTQGVLTAAFGTTQVEAYESLAIGQYNVGGGNTTTWVATDPLFEVGNGSINPSTLMPTPSDAFVVYKNGNVKAQGTVSVHSTIRCAAGGDISMGSFTAGTAP
jgi:hypothetical protein